METNLTINENGRGTILFNGQTVVIYNDKTAYSDLEFSALKKAYDSLEEKAQGGILSLEETAIRVAYMRYQQEANFKIYQPTVKTKASKKTKSVEDIIESLSGEKVEKPKRTKKTKEPSSLKQMQMKAAQLLAAKERGEILSEADSEFLDKMLVVEVLEVL